MVTYPIGKPPELDPVVQTKNASFLTTPGSLFHLPGMHFGGRPVVQGLADDGLDNCSFLLGVEVKEREQSFRKTVPGATEEELAAVRSAVRGEHTQRVRCTLGNPFRPVTTDPSWLTSTAVAFARQVYESRDFSPPPDPGRCPPGRRVRPPGHPGPLQEAGAARQGGAGWWTSCWGRIDELPVPNTKSCENSTRTGPGMSAIPFTGRAGCGRCRTCRRRTRPGRTRDRTTHVPAPAQPALGSQALVAGVWARSPKAGPRPG
ncbi:MAG: hypothetical protein JWO38_4537 [Gemmataceae bacterium]|nr:hypothetical protein [Gemmataceae bacterium]